MDTEKIKSAVRENWVILLVLAVFAFYLWGDNIKSEIGRIINRNSGPTSVEVRRDGLPAYHVYPNITPNPAPNPVTPTTPISNAHLEYINEMVRQNRISEGWIVAQTDGKSVDKLSSLESDGLIRRILAKQNK